MPEQGLAASDRNLFPLISQGIGASPDEVFLVMSTGALRPVPVRKVTRIHDPQRLLPVSEPSSGVTHRSEPD